LQLLKQNHRYVFSLIHKFNQDVKPDEPYSDRDDIIVISDEAHRTQAGKLARNMRLALPNAAFIGFTGTPLFKHDELTKRIFGDYVSRYDFKRSEEDGATVKLVYENRGEKLGLAIARSEREDRHAVDAADLDPDQTACWKSCSARITRSSPPTSGWRKSPRTSSSIAARAGKRARPCWCASTRSPAPAC
jgi:type I restriction enzyme R subunit